MRGGEDPAKGKLFSYNFFFLKKNGVTLELVNNNCCWFSSCEFFLHCFIFSFIDVFML